VLWYLEGWYRDIWREAHTALGARESCTGSCMLRDTVLASVRVHRIMEAMVSLLCTGQSERRVDVRGR
jgi:hypothetical protein